MTTTIPKPVTGRDQAYFDVFVTALEGGIGYWSRCLTYRWTLPGADTSKTVAEIQDVHGFRADVIDVERPADSVDLTDPKTKVNEAKFGEDETFYAVLRIDRDVIERGVKSFCAAMKDRPDSYHRRAAVALDWGKWDDLDFDAETADMIVQHGLFGEVVFG